MATVAALTTGCSAVLDQVAVAGGGGPAVAAPAAASGDAASALEKLPVKGRAPKTGYDREQFGPAWSDVDRNGCDTRNDILKRDLAGETFKPGTHDCVVLTGTLSDPYTGKKITFSRGQGTSEAVQIDHVIALSDAWQKGAQQLSADARKSLGNDPLNLMAVDGPTNQGKGDGDAATWLPPVALVPLHLRRAAGGGEGEVPAVGDAGRARRDRGGARRVPGPGAAHRLHLAFPEGVELPRQAQRIARASAAWRATACWSVSSATWSTTTRRRAASSRALLQSWASTGSSAAGAPASSAAPSSASSSR